MQQAPLDLQIVGSFLAIRWHDGREDFLPHEFLREESPSAANKGEVDILGQRHGGDGPRRFPGVSIVELRPTGNYAITPVFSDAHRSGVYSWSYLRSLGDLWREREKAAGS